MAEIELDYLILGAGYYGLYSADFLAAEQISVAVLEYDRRPFSRATFANQARVHFGYHYPRSLATASKTRSYFDRFNRDYGFCVKSDFHKIYAISRSFSYTSAEQFERFCVAADIPCEPLLPGRYFNSDTISGCYLTREYTYDAADLARHLVANLERKRLPLLFDRRIESVAVEGDCYLVTTNYETIRTPRILNATYASINQLNHLFGYSAEPIKYELCEVILVDPAPALVGVGITVMDGPFFSLMPFGQTGQHSLTSVAFTPHQTSYEERPTFSCQERNRNCSPAQVENCLDCPARPESAWPYMSQLARKYLQPELDFHYARSLFSLKPILVSSELDDSRPTVIRTLSERPLFRTVLSGKINTVFDLQEVLLDDIRTKTSR